MVSYLLVINNINSNKMVLILVVMEDGLVLAKQFTNVADYKLS